MLSAFRGAFGDLAEGLRLAPLWMSLGWDQTLTRFRRTVLGPFWLSANLLAISFALAVVFGGLMGHDYRQTFPQIIAGILTWTVLGGAYGEASGLFVMSGGTMMTQRLPLSFHVLLMMYRVFVNFVAQLLTLWAVFLLMRIGGPPTWQVLLGLPLLFCTSSLICLIIAIPSTRYRDFGQFVANLVSLLFFLTPVFWTPTQMSRRQQFLVTYNPLAHLLEIVREPLIGRRVDMVHWEWSLATFAVTVVVAIAMLAAYRKRVVFWL